MNYEKKIKSTTYGQIRIIGGKWRGHKLSVFNYEDLRPTTNKIRETLFNWLIPIIEGAHCFDCFAGSGALSIEALSRYAASATLIELNKFITKQLVINLLKLKAKNAQVINIDILKHLVQIGIAYDVIFLDPPFHNKHLLEQTALLLEQNGWLAKKCWIYIETGNEANLLNLPKNWYVYRKKKSRKIIYSLYIRYQ
ncbi:MAG: 16S rRNA (guanine(966)-N(2))-methyltransferase RsmD [Arsenophonus sp. ET-LJ4-MAG3]